MARIPVAIELSEQEERELRAALRTSAVSRRATVRAQIVLRAADGATDAQIAAEVGVSVPTVSTWRRNFAERRISGLADAPRSGRPREFDDDDVRRVLAMTAHAPPHGARRWSVRRIAAATGVSPTTVRRILLEHGRMPDRG